MKAMRSRMVYITSRFDTETGLGGRSMGPFPTFKSCVKYARKMRWKQALITGTKGKDKPRTWIWKETK